MTAEAEGAFGGASGPDRPQVDADGRKDRDMENCEDTLGKLFRLLKLEGNAAKPEIQDASAAAALVTDDGVGVGSDHGDALGFALNRKRRLGNGRGSLFYQSSCGG